MKRDEIILRVSIAALALLIMAVIVDHAPLRPLAGSVRRFV